MKFNKEHISIISLSISGIATMITMISIFFFEDKKVNTTDSIALSLLIILLFVTILIYSYSVIKRTKPIHHIYISFSNKDKQFATKIYSEININLSENIKYKFDVFFKEEIPFGENIDEIVERKISSSNIYLLLVTSNYIDDKNCKKEFMKIYNKYINRKRDCKVSIIPIVGDYANLSLLPRDLSNIKSLMISDSNFDENFSVQIKKLTDDLIGRQKDRKKQNREQLN